MKFQTTFTVT